MDLASEDPICLLIEILSGKGLVVRDRKAGTSDPYIKVKLDGRDLHQTKKIPKTLNPVYSDAQNNAFILDCSAKDLFAHQGLLFKVKDHNMLKTDEDMGSIQVPAMEIYKASGEAQEFVLVAPSDLKGQNAGTISIRCMPATEAHLKKYGKKGLVGFIKKAEERARVMQNNAKERVTVAKEKMAEVAHGVQDSVQDLNPVKFSKKSEAEEEEEEDAAPAQAKEIPIDSLPMAASEDDDLGDQVMGHRKIVVEVVAGRNLLIGDTASSDPYVKVMLGDREMHKTKHLTKTLNPLFTPELESTFILDCTDAVLSDNNGLTFIVKDYDFIGNNEELGTVQVAYPAVIKGNGGTLEFVVNPPKGIQKPAGNLLLRFRKATTADVEAMKDKKNKRNMFPTTTAEATAAAWGSGKPPEPAAPTAAAPAPAPKSAATEPAAKSAPVPEPAATATPKPGEYLHLKIEIVSCRGLISADKNGLSDPYVKLCMGGKDLHKTKHILKTLNPVFADMDNIFTLHCPADELFDAGGLDFVIKDWDRFGANDDLGSLKASASKIYSSMNGEDIELKISPPKDKLNDDAGHLIIRCTTASSDDHTGEKKTFMGMKVPEIKAPVIAVPKMKPMTEMFSKDKSLAIDENEDEVSMFIQIVSCRGLLVADKTGTSDPYVKVKLGKKDVHETKYIEKTLNPEFSSQHNPFFVLGARPSEVRAGGGITFRVKDYDRFGSNDDLGSAVLDPDTFFKCEGGNMELKLSPPKGIGEDAGYITIRCRPATKSDRATKSMFGFGSSNFSAQDYGKIDLHLLIEIVSAWNIPIADLTSSDPYVKARIGPRNVHETKPITKTRDPIYTIKHNSVFILDTAKKELTENGGMNFKLKDYDMVGANDDLCEVTVPAETLFEATGERLEFQLKDPADKDAGWLAIRVREVTEYDREFLKNIKAKGKSGKDFLGLQNSYARAMNTVGGGGATGMLKNMMKKRVKEVNGVKKFKIRPSPDPDRKEATEFMSKEEINTEFMKPSKKWLDIGSGGLGKIFVEILGADGLPNKDVDIVGTGNKTDPFVSVVCEDSVAKTDVIDDVLSPRWLPWMQRAFIFHVMHTSSNLHIGVFDYDPGFASDHDICGRVSIDLANLQPDTEYILRYNIYENSVMPDREAKGILMVRLRMELKEEKELILSNLQMPPEFFVNVQSGKDFDLVRQTVGGRQDLQAYNKDTIQLYIDELQGYIVLKYYLIDAIKSILFWRGQVKIFGFWLPIHSVAVFFAGVTLAEKPSLYPSYWFFGLGWLLLSVQTWRNNTSNPWLRTKTFMSLTQELLMSMSFDGPPTRIAAHENEVESKAEEKERKDRIEKAEKQAEEYNKAQMELLQEHEAMMAQVGDQNADTDISTQNGGMSIDPLKFILYPIQQYLAMACNALRLVKNFVIWDEPYVAYIITLASFAIGVVFLIVPWAFLIRWTSRILAWLLLGPHMKFVDIYWYSKMEDLTDEEQRQQIEETLTLQLDTARQYAAAARMLREDAIKLRDVKKALFGSFITKVPVLRSERFPDIPLHSSTATPYTKPESPVKAVTEKVSGQHLVGHMIPRVLEDEEELPPAKEVDAKKKD